MSPLDLLYDNDGSFKADLKPMEETITEKDVRVTIDNKLSFDKHITEKVNKTNSIIGVIRRTFEYLDLKTFRMIRKILVLVSLPSFVYFQSYLCVF
jgi:hypothetical protein